MLGILSFALASGCYNGLYVLSEQVFRNNGMSSKNIANLSLVALAVLLISIPIFGYLYRILGSSKPILVFNMGALLITFVLTQASLVASSSAFQIVLVAAQSAFCAPSLGLII